MRQIHKLHRAKKITKLLAFCDPENIKYVPRLVKWSLSKASLPFLKANWFIGKHALIPTRFWGCKLIFENRLSFCVVQRPGSRLSIKIAFPGMAITINSTLERPWRQTVRSFYLFDESSVIKIWRECFHEWHWMCAELHHFVKWMRPEGPICYISCWKNSY